MYACTKAQGFGVHGVFLTPLQAFFTMMKQEKCSPLSTHWYSESKPPPLYTKKKSPTRRDPPPNYPGSAAIHAENEIECPKA